MTAKPAGSALLPWLGTAAIVVLLDQITKAVILRPMAVGDSQVITSFFNLVHWRRGRCTGNLFGTGVHRTVA